jgi:hypothetical protein
MNEPTAAPPKNYIDTGTLELSLGFTAVVSALAAAQAGFAPVAKNRTATVTPKDGGRGFTFDYADLASVLAAVMPSLTKNGLAVLQPVTNDGGVVRVQTWLIHGTSGEWIRTKPLALEGGRDQKALGIATTYLRRYQVSALLSIAPEDDVDDGFETQERTPAAAARRPPPADRSLEPGEDPPAMKGAGDEKAVRAAIAAGDFRKALELATSFTGPARDAIMAEYRAAKAAKQTPTTPAANGAPKEHVQ